MIVAGVWCAVLAFVVFRDYGVYILSRWVITTAAIYGAVIIPTGWRFALVAVAVVFNPIVPLHLGRDVWKVVDAAAAVVFFISAFLKKND